MILAVGDSVPWPGSGTNVYTITKHGPNNYHCTCLSWKFMNRSNKERVCKHIESLLEGEPVPTTPKATKQVKQINASEKTPVTDKKRKNEATLIEVTLADKWTTQKIDGYYMSEKLDGMRCLWNGDQLLTRNGNVIHAPETLVKQLPSLQLDGELFLGRGKFQELMSITKRTIPDEKQWDRVEFKVFDAPCVNGPFPARLEAIKESLVSCKWASMLSQERCKGPDHVMEELDRIVAEGGEGVMLRNPQVPYKGGRSNDLLKVKKFLDDEAYVTGYEQGTGRNKNRMGALQCQDSNGITFKIGTGFPDFMRDNPPKIGTKITYKYQEKTQAGKPRFPVFMRIRED